MKRLYVLMIVVGVMVSGVAWIADALVVETSVYPKYIDNREDTASAPFAVYVEISDATAGHKVRVRTTTSTHLTIWNGTAWGSAHTYDNAPEYTISGDGTWSGWIYVRGDESSGDLKTFVKDMDSGETFSEGVSHSITYMDMSTAGAWVYATAASVTTGKAVLAFNSSDQIIGTYAIEDNGVDEGYSSTSGYFKMAVPANTSIPKLQARNSDNTVYNTQTNNWQSGAAGSDTDLDSQQDVTLPVTLSSFAAIPTDSGVALKWRTESEVGNIGFNIYRSENKDGTFVKINDKLIPGAGNSAMPNSYQFVDKTAIKGREYYYYLEDVDVAGLRNKFSIISSKNAEKLAATWGRIKKGS